MKNRKLDAILACRVEGTRLYGKPVQYLDINSKLTVLEHLVRYITSLELVDDICLAISDEKPNIVFAELAEKNGWKYCFGSPLDVLARIIKAGKETGATDVFRTTSECPFMYTNGVEALFEEHVTDGYHHSRFRELPEGSGFEIINMEALITSHESGNERHRSELVTSFIFDNQSMFKLLEKDAPEYFRRSEVRITVDYPEDLIFCRRIFHDLKGYERMIPVEEIIQYWDDNPEIRKQVEQIGVDWGHGRLWD